MRPVAARASLSAASTDSVPELVRTAASIDAGADLDQALGQQASERRDAELRQARRVAVQQRLQLLLDERVVAAEREHAVAGVEVQVLSPSLSIR